MRWIVLCVALFGVSSASLMARQGLAAGMNPVALSAWRLTVSSICFLTWQWTAGREKSESTRWSKEHLLYVGIAGLCLGLHFATWIGSLSFISVARSTLLVSTSPLWAGLAGLVIPSLKPNRGFWIGLLVAVLGTWLVTTQGEPFRDTQLAWIGDLLAIVGAACVVPYLVFSNRLQQTYGAFRTITGMNVVACICLWCIAGLGKQAMLPPNLPTWGSILGMAVFAQMIGHSFLNWSLKHFTPGQVAISTLAEPIFAAGLAWIFLGERITLGQGLGGAVVLVGVAIAINPSRPVGIVPSHGS